MFARVTRKSGLSSKRRRRLTAAVESLEQRRMLWAIGDTVWADLNCDGIQNAGEPGLANVTVQLKDSNGNVIRTTTTDASGFYQFTGLSAGTYTVVVATPAGYGPTVTPPGDGAPHEGDVTQDNDRTPLTAEWPTERRR